MVVCDQGVLPKSHGRLGRKRLGLPCQMPRHWQASLRQDLYLVVTGSVLGFLSASLLVVSQRVPCRSLVLRVLQHCRVRQTPGTFTIARFGRLLRPVVAYGEGYSITPPSQGNSLLHMQASLCLTNIGSVILCALVLLVIHNIPCARVGLTHMTVGDSPTVGDRAR